MTYSELKSALGIQSVSNADFVSTSGPSQFNDSIALDLNSNASISNRINDFWLTH